MRDIDLLLTHASEVATPLSDGGFRTTPDGAVAVDAGKILAVGTTAELTARFRGRETRDLSGRTVTPGLVDPHTHLVFAGDRADEFERRIAGADYMAILQAGGGILSTVRAVRAASDEELLRLGRERMRVLAAGGVTAVEVKSGYGLSLEHELRCLRVARKLGEEGPLTVRVTFLGAHAVPPEYANDRAAYVDLVAGPMTRAVAAEGLADYADVFCDQGAFTVAESERILRAGLDAGLRPKLHAEEIACTGGAELAARLGAASADHLVHVSEAGIAAMVEAGVVPVVLPSTTLFLAKDRFAPARRMIGAGLPVALATDWNPGTSWCASMQAVMVLAATRLKLSPAEALTAATLHSARAIGLERVAGSLEPGRPADLAVWNVPTHKHLVYRLGDVQAETVYINGKPIEQGGRT